VTPTIGTLPGRALAAPEIAVYSKKSAIEVAIFAESSYFPKNLQAGGFRTLALLRWVGFIFDLQS
jgi:hypothetical protein